MTATLADLRKLPRPLPAFAAFQDHFLSTFATINSLTRKVIDGPSQLDEFVASIAPFSLVESLLRGVRSHCHLRRGR
jgi:hypothetical protein